MPGNSCAACGAPELHAQEDCPVGRTFLAADQARIDHLIAQSSLGTPEALALRERTPKAVVEDILRKVDASYVRVSVDLLRSLAEDSDCRFDHHGGCQEHGYLDLGPGELCPQADLKMLLADHDRRTGGDDAHSEGDA